MLFQNFIRRVLIWLGFISKPHVSARLVSLHPAPEKIKPGEILVVGDTTYQKWACFTCPGGCGEKIQLSLNQKQQPSWKITIDSLGLPTIYPSVRQINECHCHFWIRKGIVQWCTDSGKK